MSTAIIVLAAGGSSRLGHAKQRIQIDGTTMLRHAIDAATKSTANSTFVILGADADRLERELDGLDATPVLNPGWQEGIASSIRAGMNAIPDATDAVLLMLCDQPRVSTGVLDAIITRHHTNPASIVASGYAGTIGVPALFPRAFFPELRSLMGDKGAKQIMERHRAVTLTIPFPGGAIDIDTQDDLERMET